MASADSTNDSTTAAAPRPSAPKKAELDLFSKLEQGGEAIIEQERDQKEQQRQRELSERQVEVLNLFQRRLAEDKKNDYRHLYDLLDQLGTAPAKPRNIAEIKQAIRESDIPTGNRTLAIKAIDGRIEVTDNGVPKEVAEKNAEVLALNSEDAASKETISALKVDISDKDSKITSQQAEIEELKRKLDEAAAPSKQEIENAIEEGIEDFKQKFGDDFRSLASDIAKMDKKFGKYTAPTPAYSRMAASVESMGTLLGFEDDSDTDAPPATA